MATTERSGGLPALDVAIATLGQLNALLPAGIGLGITLVQLIRQARARGEISAEQANALIDEFKRVSQQVYDTANEWLATHPRTEG